MPNVAIEIASPSQGDVMPPSLARTLVDACAAAMHDGDCALDSDRSDTPPTAVAIVRWDGDEHHVRIEVGKKDRRETAWQSRELDFSESDARIERWRAVGLTIATLAGELGREQSPARTPAPATPHSPTADAGIRPRSPEPAELSGPPMAALWFDLGGLIGNGLGGGPARFGVWADVGARLGRTPLTGIGGVDFAAIETSPSLSVQWLGVSAGLGAELGGSKGPLFEPSVAFALERIRAAATDSERSDAETELGYGVRANATFVWQLGLVSPAIGARGYLNAEPVRILVHDQYVGTLPQAGGSVLLGARIRIE